MFRPVLNQTTRDVSRRMQSTKSNPFEAFAAQLNNNKNKPRSTTSRSRNDKQDTSGFNKDVMKGLLSGVGEKNLDSKPKRDNNNKNNNNRFNNDRFSSDRFNNNRFNNNRFNNKRDDIQRSGQDKPRFNTGDIPRAQNNNTNSNPADDLAAFSSFLSGANKSPASNGKNRTFDRNDNIRGNLGTNQDNQPRRFQNFERGNDNIRNSPRFNQNNRNDFQRNDTKQSKPWRRNEPQEPEIPKWEYGTDLEKDYMNQVLKTVYETHPEGNIKFISENGDIEDSTILRYFDIVPQGKVMGIVNIQEDEITKEKIAVIKYFERVSKIKQFSDERAKELTEQFGRTKVSKRKDQNVKHVKVTWEISQSDLDNQKTNEINGHLSKGHKLQIVIGEKRGMNRRVFDDDIKDKEIDEDAEIDEMEEIEEEIQLNDLEERRRNKVLDQIKLIFNEKATIEVKGQLSKRISITATPLEKQSDKKGDVKNDKDAKKLARQEKERQRLEKKKAKEEEKKKRAAEFLQSIEN
ncbi:hypothetical protein BN7_2633 [Wickerhamomyces ciferrii]|uniref:Altered inheritance of mitochondria protein 23, mitochondrial n=1 Tax=Wickerhamomyces ciferrii (strain ATCC 14091 / BCRC 22168 / CBS 111 / JCM 3599 / NBRC 0793 / NRRL Y-1031 F-60-10) TaxID=1206466 RepID=K0KJD6_WICCF|nr:uncharacterized protein BN7_2633 [Wickerhamomyces ciferrii]CCH43086.1 hypothetical protein BN7_2633 [Wickerhamomyces ciferrii]